MWEATEPLTTTTHKHLTIIQLLLALLFHCLYCRCRRFLQLLNIVLYAYRIILPPLTAFIKAAYQANFLLPWHWRSYPGHEFCYAAIKTTERWAEETEELLRGPFNPEESGAMKREIGCKDVMYHKCNDYDKHNEQWLMTTNWLMYLKHNNSNESNEKQQLLPPIMSSDADNVLA